MTPAIVPGINMPMPLATYNTDVYKTGHKPMLPVGSTLMNSNFMPRSGKHSNCPNNGLVVSIGEQMTAQKIHEMWDVNFFQRPVEEIYQFGRDMTMMLMLEEPFDVSHIVELHELGYLPLEIKALPEGIRVPYGTPFFTIENTAPMNGYIADWIVNYLETYLSLESWQCPTSATLSFAMRELSYDWIMRTDPDNIWFVDYQNHDFSMRGLSGLDAVCNSGIGFASSSRGSDTLPVIPLARKYYDEPMDEVCINSVIASEHAIMCTLTGFFLITKEGSWERIGDLEVETFRYLLKKFPTGILSLVSDTWDLWRVILDYCEQLKDEIMARNGKLVIRPDSGDPVDIMAGNANPRDLSLTAREEYEKYYDGYMSYAQYAGVVQLLWDIFGGTVNDQGYRVLDPHVGAIYGDAINYDRASRIYQRLADKGFASTNVVLGVGSYSLQYVTRDTHGFAQKATYVEVAGQGIDIFKDPVTSTKTAKKSPKGRLRVMDEDGEYVTYDQCTDEEYNLGILRVIYRDGQFYNRTTLTEIRQKLNAQCEANWIAKQQVAIA